MSDKELNDWLMGKDNHPDPPYERDTTTDRKQEEDDDMYDPFEPTVAPTPKPVTPAPISTAAQPPRTPIDPAQMHKLIGDEIKKPAPEKEDNLLIIKPSYQWIEDAMQEPIPTMLFDEFWNEGEICILFADTNTGKSILAVQIADSISRGVPLTGFRLEAKAQPVIYFDFELSKKQYELRYSVNYREHYPWHPNMKRAEINQEQISSATQFEDRIITCIEKGAINHSAKVLVIDNLTYLRDDNERARDAKPLMQKLMNIKQKYGLSLLILAHTPKRDLSSPLTLNHLQGSKMLMNFCDSSFCIGTSTQDKSLRYLKQVKVRAAEYRYTDDNVALCRIEKPHNFLRFAHIGYSSEREHLREKEDRKEWLIAESKRLKEEGMIFEDIAKELGISKSSAERYVKK